MAIQFRRGEENDLVSENLLIGEPAYCTDSHKLLISRGNGVNDLIVRESEVDAKVESEVSAVLDEHLDDVIATATERKLLWSGTLTAGNTVTLSDDLWSYRFIMFKAGTFVTFPIAGVYNGVSSIRATGSFAGEGLIEIQAIRGTYTKPSDIPTFKLDMMASFNISTSGITNNATYTNITEIWGLK